MYPIGNDAVLYFAARTACADGIYLWASLARPPPADLPMIVRV